MPRRSTLKDLDEFLSQNPNDIEVKEITSKEDFLNKSPKNIVDIDEVKAKTESDYTISPFTSSEEIAQFIHDKAKRENRSFTEIWLKILEQGARHDPLLENTSLFKTIKTINKTTLNVALESINKLVRRK